MLDVSVALTNPYTLDTFTIQRRVENVSSTGLGVLSPTVFQGIRGVVHPAGDNDLSRLPDEEQQSKSIVVITRFALRGSTQDGVPQNWKPDIVQWNNNNFLVRHVDDYSKYARGFIYTICVMQDMIAQPGVTR